MKRKLLRTVLVLAVLLLIAGTAIYLWPQDPITEASWQKIRLGMSETDVEEILGRPGLSDKEGKQQYEALMKQLGKEPFIPEGDLLAEPDNIDVLDVPPTKVWLGRRGLMSCHIDETGRITAKVFMGWRPAEPTFLERLRDWLGW